MDGSRPCSSLLVDLLPPEAELDLREVEDVALAQGGLADALAVHEGAVLAAEVADVEGPPPQEELGVLLRHRVRGEGQGEVGEAAHPERQGVHRDPPQLAAALHEALEVPAEDPRRRPGWGTGGMAGARVSSFPSDPSPAGRRVAALAAALVLLPARLRPPGPAGGAARRELRRLYGAPAQPWERWRRAGVRLPDGREVPREQA